MNAEKPLSGQVALVTGGSQGIGLAIVRRLSQMGARVALCGRNRGKLEQADKSLRAEGLEPLAVLADVSRPPDVTALVEQTNQRLGAIDILVNNAGVIRVAPVVAMSEEDWDLVLDVNLKGTFLVCQAAMAHMAEHGGGRISNTASVAVRGNFGQANYSASKAGIVGLTRTLALEGAKAGITVNCVAPGATDTAMFAGVPDEVKAAIVKSIPLRRMATPADIAAVHAFLCSDDAAYVTGQLLYADGGATLGV